MVSETEVVEHGLTFEGKAFEMFSKVCDDTPWLFRHFTRSGILNGIKAHKTERVNEELLYTVMNEVVPKEHLERTLKIMDDIKAGSGET